MRAGEIFADIYAKAHPGEDDRRVEAENNRFSLAPLVVGVISRAAPHQKIPEWEQILSAGAVCMNLMVAANAFGFASVWLTGWHAYDRRCWRGLALQSMKKSRDLSISGARTIHARIVPGLCLPIS